MPRILILTASYGSGHNAAARTLAAAFQSAGAGVTIVDHFRDLVHPLFERASRALYYAVLRRAPTLWGLAYGLGDRMPSDSPLAFGMTRVGTAALGALLESLRPDAVVTVHATPATAMSFLARTRSRVAPHTTVVTDFVAHGQWIAAHVDRYCVADDEVKHEFVARGIPSERVIVTGVPVRSEFAGPMDALEARRDLGLGTDRPVILAMAGSRGGLGRLPDVVDALVRARRPLAAIVVAGHDGRLVETLRREAEGTGIRILGYVSDVRRLMAAADLLITKAGGMTLAEAMAAEVPVLTYGSLAGQERQNERFASRAGVALVARSRRELSRLLDHALSKPELLEDLRQHMRRFRRPGATRHIVEVVLERTAVR